MDELVGGSESGGRVVGGVGRHCGDGGRRRNRVFQEI